jgi:phage shock protein A
MLANATHREQRLVGLCRRLLKQNEQLHAQTKQLYETLHWLGGEYRELKARFDRAAADHAVIEAASDAMIGAALDGPLSGASSGRR